MSSQPLVSDFVASLQLGRQQLYKFGGPILMVVGTVSCILSLIVFTKKNLRKNPCSIYFIAFHIANFLLIYTIILLATLSLGYDITPSSSNLGLCRFGTYIGVLLDILCPSYLILASVDRMLVTSPDARTRQRSTLRLAYICIISVTLFWGLFHISALVLGNIVELAPNYFICYFESGIYVLFLGYYSLIIKAILVPSTMAICGLWSIKNIRSMRHVRIAPVFVSTRRTAYGGLHSVYSKDRQLVRMLVTDIVVYIIFSFMLSVVLMYLQITQYNVKSFDQIQIDLFLRYVSTFSSNIPLCIGCFTNLFVSRTFRNELKNALLFK